MVTCVVCGQEVGRDESIQANGIDGYDIKAGAICYNCIGGKNVGRIITFWAAMRRLGDYKRTVPPYLVEEGTLDFLDTQNQEATPEAATQTA